MNVWARRVFFFLLVISAILQVVIARRSSLWTDEFFSLAMATGHSLEHPAAMARPELGDFVEPNTAVPASQFRRYLQHENPPASPARVIRAVLLSDTSPPLYYLMLEDWTLIFGTSDLALRLFSITFSIASLPLIAALGCRFGGPRAATTSCTLFVFSPMVVYFSTEGRMYSVLMFLTLAIAMISLLLQEHGPHVGYCLLWVAVSAAGFLSHYFFVFAWLASAVFLFLDPGKFERRWLVAVTVGVALFVLPWAWAAAAQFSGWKVTQGWLNEKPFGFHRTIALALQFTQFFFSRGHGLWRTPWWSTLSAIVLFGTAAVLAVWRLGWQLFCGRRLLLWLWLIAGCAGPTAVDLLQHTYLAASPRYALAGLPAACLLGGVVFSSIGRIGPVLLCLFVVAWLPDLHNIYTHESRYDEPFEKAAQIISATAKASDVVLIHSIPSGVLGIARYVETSAALASWIQQLGNRRVPESLQTLAHGRSRILLLKLHAVGAPAPEEDWLRANAVTIDQSRTKTLELIQFEPGFGSTF